MTEQDIPGQEGIERAVHLDPNYIRLISGDGFLGKDQQLRKEYAHKSMVMYESLLNGRNTPIRAIEIAQSERFQMYIARTTQEASAPGPIFQKVMRGLQQPDQTTIDFLDKYLDYLPNFDKTFFTFDYYVESARENQTGKTLLRNLTKQQIPLFAGSVATALQTGDADRQTIRTYNDFQNVADNVFGAIFKNGNKSAYRSFMTLHFMPTWLSLTQFGEDLSKYDPKEQNSRIKKLASTTDPQTWSLLEAYLICSEPRSGFYGEWLDEEFETGQLDNAYSFSQAASTYSSMSRELPSVKARAKKLLQGFVQREVTSSQLQEIVDMDEVSGITTKFLDGLNDEKKKKVIAEYLEQFILDEYDSSQSEAFQTLLDAGIMPTKALIHFITDNTNPLAMLSNLADQTEYGNFNPDNQVQKDLQLGRYLDLRNDHKGFRNVPYISESTQTPELMYDEKREARAAAYEAANVYWLAREFVDHGRNALVVGNQRYGANFVVEPLEFNFNSLPQIPFAYYRVSSSGSGKDSIPDAFPSSFIQRISTDKTDIIFVDGTYSIAGENDLLRMPRSMFVLNWFLAYNEAVGEQSEEYEAYLKELRKSADFNDIVKKIQSYNPKEPYDICHWNPLPYTNVDIGGNLRMPYNPALKGLDRDSAPRLVLANSVIDPNVASDLPKDLLPHTPGFWDDSEKRADTKRTLAFTGHGLETLSHGRTREEVLQLAQEEIARNIQEMIRRTDPFNK